MTIQLLDNKLIDETPKKNYIRKGISIPFMADSNGKIKTSSGQQLDEEDIMINLLDTDNENAFFQIDNFELLMFKTENPKSFIVNNLRRIFNMFERQNRMRLIEETVVVEVIERFVYITFDYFNIEENTTRNMSLQGQI